MKTNQKHSLADNDVFVTLIRVAQEDADMRRILMGILQQPPFHRRSMLNNAIQTMNLRGAPANFVAAVTALLDDEVAEKAAEMIRG